MAGAKVADGQFLIKRRLMFARYAARFRRDRATLNHHLTT